jgi:CelD/BcsL family acetyltransferase involved in cellulose biosynthesis
MIVTLVPGNRLAPEHVRAWAAIQEAEPALQSPFFRPELTQIVADVRDDVAVGVVADGGLPIAFFPFQRGRFGIGRPVGGRLSDYQGVVALDGVVVDARGLLRGCRLTAWEFDGLVASQGTFAPFHRSRRGSPVLDLSDGFERYVQGRRAAGSDQVDDLLQQVRRLERECGPLRFEARTRDARVLDRLLRWKSEQYLRTGALDIFTRPWVVETIRRVHDADEPAFAGMLSALYAGDELVAAHLGLRSASVWHYWLPAYSRAHARASPGLILLLRMAEAAPGLGLRAVDLGKGDALYKRRLASGVVELAEGVARTRSVGGALSACEHLGRRLLRRTPFGTRSERAAIRRRFA